MRKIVFLGDSITDAGRNTSNGSTISIGQGYALIVTAGLSTRRPGEFEFLNTAVSGSRVVDLYARVKKDAWNHEPDVISILVGVNDVWHELGECPNGVEAERFENVYRMLLEDTRKRLPAARLMLLEPFVLRAAATEACWERFRAETRLRAGAVRRLAEEFGACFVPLQARFDDACRKQAAAFWLADGVHPTPAGHQLIADAWMCAFEEMEQTGGRKNAALEYAEI